MAVAVRRAKAVAVAIAAAASGGAAAVAVRNRPRIRRTIRRRMARLARALRYERGRLRGVRYRVLGGSPTADVTDDLLADRIRSTIGPLEKRLDVPRVDVSVADHVATVSGRVGGEREAMAIRDAVAAVSGVKAVRSLLGAGPLPPKARPSEGGAALRPSAALERLLWAARAAGMPAQSAPGAVRAVLAVLVERLPDGERAHVLLHLPQDVRQLVGSAAASRRDAARMRTIAEFAAAVEARADFLGGDPEAVASAVLAALKQLVPEEAVDVAAVLPSELRRLWTEAAETPL